MRTSTAMLLYSQAPSRSIRRGLHLIRYDLNHEGSASDLTNGIQDKSGGVTVSLVNARVTLTTSTSGFAFLIRAADGEWDRACTRRRTADCD